MKHNLKQIQKVRIFPLLVFILLLIAGCKSNSSTTSEQDNTSSQQEYYSVQDYYNVKKYDVHIHVKTFSPNFPEFCKKENYNLVSINVNDPHYLPIAKQQEMTIYQSKKFPGSFNYATTFTVDDWNNKNWQGNVISYLKNSFDSGAVAVKIWKNIGMSLKDKNGKFVMVDDPRFDTVINFIAKNKITLIGHLGEPKNCWLPLDQMTVSGDREYFRTHPQYHMFLHPEDPSYEDQINARDRMLDKHPDITFIGAHLGSLEWDVDEIAKRLDKYPNMAVETAARVSHLQHQAVLNHKKVYDFFIKYQDRIIYGSDLEVTDQMDPANAAQNAHDTWFGHWKFFASDETLTAPDVKGSFTGLHLPKEVLDKFYYTNVRKWIPGLQSKGQ